MSARALNGLLLRLTLMLPATVAALAVALAPESAAPVKNIFRFVCHQLPERSYGVGAGVLPICRRDTWLYAGLFLRAIVPVTPRIDESVGVPALALYMLVLFAKIGGVEFHWLSLSSALIGGFGLGCAARFVQRRVEQRILPLGSEVRSRRSRISRPSAASLKRMRTHSTRRSA